MCVGAARRRRRVIVIVRVLLFVCAAEVGERQTEKGGLGGFWGGFGEEALGNAKNAFLGWWWW